VLSLGRAAYRSSRPGVKVFRFFSYRQAPLVLWRLCQRLTIFDVCRMFLGMATKTRNISLPPKLDAWAEQRARSGLYGNLSAVVQAGLRALQREEMGVAWREWQEAKASLPPEPITPAIEERIAARVRSLRQAERRKALSPMTAICSFWASLLAWRC